MQPPAHAVGKPPENDHIATLPAPGAEKIPIWDGKFAAPPGLEVGCERNPSPTRQYNNIDGKLPPPSAVRR